MKNLTTLLVALTFSLTVNAQDLTQVGDNSIKTSSFGFGSRDGFWYNTDGDFAIKYNHSKWAPSDLVFIMTELDGLLTDNGLDIDSPEYYDSSIILSKDDYDKSYTVNGMMIHGHWVERHWDLKDTGGDVTHTISLWVDPADGILLQIVEDVKFKKSRLKQEKRSSHK